jgi:hypothetical protein
MASGTGTTERFTDAKYAEIRAAIYEVAEAERPVSVRGVFYRVMSRGLVPKNETRGYRVIQRQALAMRRAGDLPYSWIADGSRTRTRLRAFDGLDEWGEDAARFYRRRVWTSQDVDLEVWVEKDAISGVVSPVLLRWDVPLFVARGFSSETFLWSAANEIVASGKDTIVYHLGDHDASGILAANKIGGRLEELVGEVAGKHRRLAPLVHFDRLAVTADQIEEWSLPTRPGKESTHSAGFTGPSVEIDAVPSDTLRTLVEDAIMEQIDERRLQPVLVAEKSERETIRQIAAVASGTTTTDEGDR